MGDHDRRTRVLFWSEQFWPTIGGIEVWGAKLLPALQERGFEIAVVTAHGSLDLPDTDWYRGIPIYRFPFWKALRSHDIDQLTGLRAQVADLRRTFEPDLVHFNISGPSVYFCLLTNHAHPAPTLVSLHQPLHYRSAGPDSLLGRLLRSADWVTGGSATVLAEAHQLVPEIIPRSSLIYYGMDPPPLPPEPLPFGPARLLCLGRLVPEKGFDLAVKAFAGILHRFPDVRLVIASSGPTRAALERQAADLGLAHAVDFLGWIDFADAAALMNSATIVLMPSRAPEGFGLVALEAALMARPVVATRVGALPEVVIHLETGLLIEKEDSHALGAAIAFLLEHPGTAAAMGHAARTRAQAIFGFERHLGAFESLYRQLARGGNPWGSRP